MLVVMPGHVGIRIVVVEVEESRNVLLDVVVVKVVVGAVVISVDILSKKSRVAIMEY